MNKQDLINSRFEYICTKISPLSENKMELWAKFSDYQDMVIYLYYLPETDTTLEQPSQTISYEQLDMMAQMRDKMRKHFVKLNIEHDKENI